VEEYDVCMRKIERVSIPWITTTIDLEKNNHGFYRSTAAFKRKRCNIQKETREI
jgi:hypothetical protein